MGFSKGSHAFKPVTSYQVLLQHIHGWALRPWKGVHEL